MTGPGTSGPAAVTVRDAVPGDVSALAALERACFGPDAWSVSSVAAELAGAPTSRYVLVAEPGVSAGSDGAVVGYASLVLGPSVADLARVAVLPTHRRRGLGRRLVEDLLAHSRAHGCERVLLEVAADNAPALALYGSLGFVPIARREGYYGLDRDAVVLQVRL